MDEREYEVYYEVEEEEDEEEVDDYIDRIHKTSTSKLNFEVCRL
jgi:hypothetical protein